MNRTASFISWVKLKIENQSKHRRCDRYVIFNGVDIYCVYGVFPSIDRIHVSFSHTTILLLYRDHDAIIVSSIPIWSDRVTDKPKFEKNILVCCSPYSHGESCSNMFLLTSSIRLTRCATMSIYDFRFQIHNNSVNLQMLFVTRLFFLSLFCPVSTSKPAFDLSHWPNRISQPGANSLVPMWWN